MIKDSWRAIKNVSKSTTTKKYSWIFNSWISKLQDLILDFHVNDCPQLQVQFIVIVLSSYKWEEKSVEFSSSVGWGMRVGIYEFFQMKEV